MLLVVIVRPRLDMALTFVTVYEMPMDQGGHIIINSKEIAMHYFRGYFLIDFIALMPYDVLYNTSIYTDACETTLRVTRRFFGRSDLSQ